MKRIFAIIFPLIATIILACQEKKHTPDKQQTNDIQRDTDFRPNFHFTPKNGWMNDPNGMFYLNGTYHLFFQHYPDGNTWGPMHWGHATSKDLISWNEQPIALKPDEHGYIFSGSAVVDTLNTSGFGNGIAPPVIAMFTYHDPQAAKEGKEDFQSQAIAYSLDEGETWTKYEQNPVIKNPGIKDFRDPKLQWDEFNRQWVMVLAAHNKVMFYTSTNLKKWILASEWGEGVGAHGGVWECPDFFPMKVAGTTETKWVLIQSLNPGAYNGGSGTQYFVGDFDGKNFIPDSTMTESKNEYDYWIDFGKDNYAGVTWNNVPKEDGRKLFVGWMSNWQYANEVPTETWRSAMTLPRKLTLKKEGDAYRIFSSPVKELDKYLKKTIEIEEFDLKRGTSLASDSINLAKVHITFDIPNLKNRKYEFALLNNTGDTLKFGYDNYNKLFYVDRKKSGLTEFADSFAKKLSKAPRISESKILPIEIILDRTSIELFYDQGGTVMTEIFFPKRPYEDLKVLGEGFKIENLEIRQLDL